MRNRLPAAGYALRPHAEAKELGEFNLLLQIQPTRIRLTMADLNVIVYEHLDGTLSVGYGPHTISLHYMHYNFCRVHKTLRVTPAMEAGLTDHVWSVEEVAALLDANVKPLKPLKRGPYKKRSA